jgi:hypothetical protein
VQCPGVVEKCTDAPSTRPPDGMIMFVVDTAHPDVKIFRPYCYVCNVNRPQRCAHCPICNNCVERYDHHCGLIGACIGRDNYRPFVQFLAAALLLSAWVVASSVLLLVLRFSVYNGGSGTSTEEKVALASLFLVAVLGALVFVLVGKLVVMQIQAASRGLTQREYVKLTQPELAADRNRLFDPQDANPYDRGVRANLRGMCCQD